MATEEKYTSKENFDKIKSQIRTIIETAFYGNNVIKITDLKEAYEMARTSSGTVELTDMPVFEATKQGLPADANMLLFNDGTVFGRCAAAKRVLGEPGVESKDYSAKIREAIYGTRYETMYHAEVVVGLDKDFMLKAHLLITEGHENIMYSWMLNFQYFNDEYLEIYKNSKKYLEGDIYLFSDPDCSHKDHPLGLTFFDSLHNCAAILGMRYFGEHKKVTLTLGWGTAVRNNFASCYGGIKRYNLKDKKYVVAVFGLLGSGKSTITQAKHGDKYDVTVLHDDAFIINTTYKYSLALESGYFDKTQDYPLVCEDNKYILTIQNNGATIAEDGKVYELTEDLRNGNGRAVKSKLWSANRVDRVDEPINAIFCLMKDRTIPPVLKLKGSSLGCYFGH